MSPSVLNSDAICDLQGQPLHPDSATLLKALDKLLTVGAYYSTEHEQYLRAAMKARDSIVGVIGSAKRHVAIEITAQGLMIGSQNIDPHHRNVRQMHDLLVPLNIARLEIDGTLSPVDLRQGLAALQQHKAALGQTNSFQEVVIENLPDSIRAVSCSVLRKSETEQSSGGSSLDELLGKWDENPTTEQPLSPVTETARLSQQFLDLVTQILANLEVLAGESGLPANDGGDGTYVTVKDLIALKQTLEHLLEISPDPAELALLITQAEQALSLSRDPKSVDLVFRILKKDMARGKKDPAARPDAKHSRVKYRLTVEQLQEQVAELAADRTPLPEPRAGSRANQLGIGLQLLRSDPPRALRTALITTIEQVVARPDFAKRNLAIYARAVASVVEQDELALVDDLLPLLAGILRQKNPELLARFWGHVLDAAPPEKLSALWPYLVNDILLGLRHATAEQKTRLTVAAGSLALAKARTEGHRLEKQPALQGESAARDLFAAPLAQIVPLLAMLLASPLKEWAGEELYLALRRKPTSRLVGLLINTLGEHDPQQDSFYLALVQYGQEQELPANLREPAVAILQNRLENLARDARGQSWVPEAIETLANLAPAMAQPLLARIRTERKFFFFKAWPDPARTAASRALRVADQEAQ